SLHGVAVAGGYAFAGGSPAAGATGAGVQVYDVSNPAAPLFVREQALGTGETIRGVVALDARYIAVFTEGGDGAIRLVDRQNVSSLAVVSTIAGEYEAGGVVSGKLLYAYGDYSGVTAIDFTNPAAPELLGYVDTRSGASSVAISGTNELAVAEGVAGVTFIDTTDPSDLRIKGTQQVPGAPADLAVSGKTLYVASELELDALVRP